MFRVIRGDEVLNITSLDMKVYDLLKKGLDASSLRGKVIANNIANVNTNGYKKYTVSFEETLQENMDKLELKNEDDKHMKLEEQGEITIKKDESTSMRLDGNNVDIDNEMANEAANALMYNALITQVNNRLTNTRYVINGGR
jgi:flagellar basal-body rod protein FlgB